jgi:hypothetical protein
VFGCEKGGQWMHVCCLAVQWDRSFETRESTPQRKAAAPKAARMATMTMRTKSGAIASIVDLQERDVTRLLVCFGYFRTITSCA